MNHDEINTGRAKRMLHNVGIALRRGMAPGATDEDKAIMNRILYSENDPNFYDFLDELSDLNLEEPSQSE